ncbi:MAG: hypothetical protein WDZ28_01080 [Simkaniaceae bacterium]
MNVNSYVLNAFFCSIEERSHLCSFLQKNESEKILSLPLIDQKPKEFESSFLLTIHPQFFIKPLDHYTDNDKRLFLSCLSIEQRDFLAAKYTLDPETIPLTEKAGNFLKTKLYSMILLEYPKKIIPLPCLPPHPLTPLLNLDCRNLNRIIRFLGLYDLSIEIKKVIETKVLKKIDEILSEEEKEYLKLIRTTRSSLTFSPLHLNKWDFSEESLDLVIKTRGLNRLAKALHGEEPNLIAYLGLKLGLKQALALEKLSVNIKNPEAHQTLLKEVLSVLQTLNQVAA